MKRLLQLAKCGSVLTLPLLDTIYPMRCHCCGSRANHHLCRSCYRLLLQPTHSAHNQCQICDEQAIEGASLCTACLIYPEHYRRLRSVWLYDQEAAKLIKSMKYHNRPEIIYTLISMVTRQLQDHSFWQISSEGWRKWDLIIGLPSTRIRDFTRGYRHTTIFARQLSRILQIDYSISALRRVGGSSPQASLRIKRRLDNVANTFRSNRKKVEGKQILLFDDVCTSGSSIAEAAKSLIAGGAITVDVFTLSRSPHFLKNRLITKGAVNLSKAPTLC